MNWNPWGELRNHPELEVHRRRLPGRVGGAVYWPGDGWALILLDVGAGQVERNALLAHELVHHERHGGAARQGMPDGWRDVVTRDEGIVNDEVARRLVPRDQLLEVVAARCSLGEGGTAQDVADEFGVPVEVAIRALLMLEKDWGKP